MTADLHIFPTNAAVAAFDRARLAETGVLTGTRALTLKGLVEAICAELPGNRPPLSGVGRRLLVEETVAGRYAAGSGCLASLREYPGFAVTLDGLFAELKQALIPPERFTALARPHPDNGRLQELAHLYDRYCKALFERGLLDRHDAEAASLRRLREGNDLPPLFEEVGRVVLHAIFDLTPLQLAILAEISRKIPVEMRLPYNPERDDLYAYVSRTADAIEALDDSAFRMEPIFAEPEGTFLTPLLAALDLDDVSRATTPPDGISLFAAPGAYRECEEIGRRIRQLFVRGVPPPAVAILVRDLRSYGPMLEDVCRRYRIPVSYRRGAPLATSSLVDVCLAPLSLAQEQYGREALLDLFKSGYFRHASHRLPPDSFERAFIEAGYLDESQGRLETLLSRRIGHLRRRGLDPRHLELVLDAVRPVMAELRRFRERQTVSRFIALTEEFIERHEIYRNGLYGEDLRSLKRDASAVMLLQQLFADLDRDVRTLGMTDRTFAPAEFLGLVRTGMEGIHLAGERRPGVTILNFHDARGLVFPHLFIAGLNDGLCPRRHDAHPLLKDGEKLLFNQRLGTRPFRTAAEKSQEEPLLFYLAIGCAGERLTLSYSYLDGRGNELLRSPLLDELLVATPVAEERIPLRGLSPPLDAALEREELINALALAGVGDAEPHLGELGGPLARVIRTAAIEKERDSFFQCEDPVERASRATPYVGALFSPPVRDELSAFYETSPGNRFTPTALEEFGGCPFRYFLRRLLRVVPFDRPTLELAVKDEGSLVHEVLQTFFEERKEAGRLPLVGDEGDRRAMTAALRQTTERWETEGKSPAPLLWETGREKLAALLDRFVILEAEAAGGKVPVACEHPFEELAIEDPDGARLFLEGKVDRVDRSADGSKLRVVDYKLAGNGQKYRDLLRREALGVTSFQMPVYLLAARRDFAAGRNPSELAVRYWLLRRLEHLDREFGHSGEEEWDDFFAIDPGRRRLLGEDNFANRLCATVAAMKRGEFHVTPRECGYCDYRSVCRYVEVTLRDGE